MSLQPADSQRATPGDNTPYVGRFAPSPSGPLHFGSLLAAVASYAEARTHGGRWLLRIEDIDPPREQAGADRLIIDALEACGFEWDGPVTYQSAFTRHHERLVEKLLADGHAYPCSCSRRDLADVRRGPLGAIYPGTCRDGCVSDDVAIRVRTNDEPISFTDRLQGNIVQHLESESGDFVIRRRDGLIAYHLAVVVDDFDQGITEIVRGIDLLDSTPRHIWLQRLLGFPTPGYLHIPVAVNAEGQKLSKLTGAPGIDTTAAAAVLHKAFEVLRQSPPADLANAPPATQWHWALEEWDAAPLSGITSIATPEYAAR
jgi:glutamyl-Q tRNA(Asp) synthetase